MRTISRTSFFRKDYKRESRGRHGATLDRDLAPIIVAFTSDQQLPVSYRDHALSGNYVGHRECHIRPDLLLIYKLPDAVTLRFVRLGSHSELF